MGKENTELETEVEEVETTEEVVEEISLSDSILDRWGSEDEEETTVVPEPVTEEPEEVVEEPEEEEPELEVQPTAENTAPTETPLTKEAMAELVAELQKKNAVEEVAQTPNEPTIEDIRKQIGFRELTEKDIAFMDDMSMEPAEKAAALQALLTDYVKTSVAASDLLQKQELQAFIEQQKVEKEQAILAQNQQQEAAAAASVFYTTYPELKGAEQFVDEAATIVGKRLGAMPDYKPETVKKYMTEVSKLAKQLNPNLSKGKPEGKKKKPPVTSTGGHSHGGTQPAKSDEEKKPQSLSDKILSRM